MMWYVSDEWRLCHNKSSTSIDFFTRNLELLIMILSLTQQPFSIKTYLKIISLNVTYLWYLLMVYFFENMQFAFIAIMKNRIV